MVTYGVTVGTVAFISETRHRSELELTLQVIAKRTLTKEDVGWVWGAMNDPDSERSEMGWKGESWNLSPTRIVTFLVGTLWSST